MFFCFIHTHDHDKCYVLAHNVKKKLLYRQAENERIEDKIKCQQPTDGLNNPQSEGETFIFF